MEQGGQLARYVGCILGTAPADAVGLVLGDPLHFAREVIAGELDLLFTKIQRRRNYKPQPVSPSIAIPLIRAAYDESRPELQELWAALIAAAMDPSRSSRVRLRFIETVKQFDPLDALLLRERHFVSGAPEPSAAEYFSKSLAKNLDEIAVSVDNLERLGCITMNPRHRTNFVVSVYGRELVRVCSD